MIQSSIEARMGRDTAPTAVPDLRVTSREFPFLRFTWDVPGPELSVADWKNPDMDFWSFDRRYDERIGRRFRFVLRGARHEIDAVLVRILTRMQRLFRRRNRHSADRRFEGVLERHRALHDLAKPLVRADYDHALDVWQWVLRLERDASIALQLSALLHDIDRLGSEADRRVEHRFADYAAFKRVHAESASARAAALVLASGYQANVVDRVAALVATHESPSGDEESRVLADADALSFFSLNSAGFVRHFPPAHTRRKVERTLARMSADARERLRHVRMPRGVAELVAGLRPEVVH